MQSSSLVYDSGICELTQEEIDGVSGGAFPAGVLLALAGAAFALAVAAVVTSPKKEDSDKK